MKRNINKLRKWCIRRKQDGWQVTKICSHARMLENTIGEHGKPREVLTDHGTQYYATKGQVSAFTQFCESKDIKHIFGGIGKPTTLGKIERFHRTFRETYPRFKNLEKFSQYYNSKPHKGLNYETPEKIYLG